VKRKLYAKAQKTKHLLWDTFIQSIFVDKVVILGWGKVLTTWSQWGFWSFGARS